MDSLRLALKALDAIAEWDDEPRDIPSSAVREARRALKKIRGGSGRPLPTSCGGPTFRVLLDVEKHGDPYYRDTGPSMVSIMKFIGKHQLIERTGIRWRLTDDGERFLATCKVRP
jgi:hypothetical protein